MDNLAGRAKAAREGRATDAARQDPRTRAVNDLLSPHDCLRYAPTTSSRVVSVPRVAVPTNRPTSFPREKNTRHGTC